jgi:hypothetical protein
MTERRWRIDYGMALSILCLIMIVFWIVDPRARIDRERCRQELGLSRLSEDQVTEVCLQWVTREKVDWVHPVGTLNP